MAYRQEYLIEHGFARYKGKALGLTPIYLSSTTRIKGLVRLLSIGLRILCLLEFSVREALQQNKALRCADHYPNFLVDFISNHSMMG